MVVIGFVFHTATLATLSAKTGHGPYTNPFEYASFFSWAIFGAQITATLIFRITTLGAFVTPVGFLILAWSFLLPGADGRPSYPNEYWLTLHLTLSFLALASFAVMFAGSVMYLIQERMLKKHHISGLFKKIPDLETLDKLLHGSLIFGFPLITVGMGSAFIWTITRQGSLLGTDPGRILPLLLIWIIYAVLMAGRGFLGWRGHTIALLGTIGFAGALAALGIHVI
jgi:ABC-type uncharacterized transport system permease subunit